MGDTEWITKDEIAERYGVSEAAVRKWIGGLEGWPPKGPKRGLYDTYDAALVAAAVDARRDSDAVGRLRALGSQLVTPRQVAEIFDLAPATARGFAHRGHFGEGVERDGVLQYRADVAAEYMARRRPRRRSAA
jgi:hypothetical protein